MKPTCRVSLCAVLLALLALSGCARLTNAGEYATPAPGDTAEPTRASLLDEILDPLPLPGRTRRPTATAPSYDSTPGPTPTPTLSPTPGPSPTATATLPANPTLGASTPDPFATPSTAIPDAVAEVELDSQYTNIMLLGRDTSRVERPTDYRTDVIIIVGIDRENQVVTMLSVPRDLYVYIPGWTMNRINTAAGYGDRSGYPGGGPALLAQTILYNLGIPIHYWARVDFDGFEAVVDTLGGIDVPVTCALEDWRLISPELDKQNPDNWEQFYLDTGVHTMDGDLALWYARSRRSTNDFDRSRRQHRVLRAMFSAGLSLNAVSRIPELYDQYTTYVDTNVTLGDALSFAPLATQIRDYDIKSRFIGSDQVQSWRTPQGASVLLPDPDAIAALVAEAFTPPRSSMLREAPAQVEVLNGTGNADMVVLAADNLAWDGFAAVVSDIDPGYTRETVIYDYTTSPKNSFINELLLVFDLDGSRVVAEPDPDATYPYRVILGGDFQPCTYGISFPRPADDGTPTPDEQQAAPEGDAPTIAWFMPEREDLPIAIDGELVEWGELDYTIGDVVFGPENYADAADASLKWTAAWDAEYLYLAVDVRDDVVAQYASGENLFQGDSLELLLNMNLFGDLNDEELNEDDYQFGMSPGALTNPMVPNEVYLWFPAEKQGRVLDAGIMFRTTPLGYQGEIAIPWATMQNTPSPGQTFGFVLSLIDNDQPDTQQIQTIIASHNTRELYLPNTWEGRLELGPSR